MNVIAPPAIWQRLAAAWLLLCVASHGRQLEVTDWIVTDELGRELPHVIDNNLRTAWVSDTPQMPGMHIDIDLGATYWVHRIYLTPYTLHANYPRALRVSAGLTATQRVDVARADLPRAIDTDLRFDAVAARHLRLTLEGEGAGYPWAIAEMLVYGFSHPTQTAATLVVESTAQADTLTRQAAIDLSYYLSELTGRPVRLLPPDRNPGEDELRLIIAPQPYPPAYDDYIRGVAFQSPERGSVLRHGKQIIFTGHSPHAAMYAVYEFLHRQGIRWAYPSALGDFVPSERELDLSMLPMETQPDFTDRYANWNTERDEDSGEPYLWYFRNRWSRSWGGRINDRPACPVARQTPSKGYTHTFSTWVDEDLFSSHPEWFPLLKNASWATRIGVTRLGKRLPYSATWGLNFCTSAPAIVPYIAEQIVAATDPRDAFATSWVTPMDAGVWCECDACRAQDDPAAANTGTWRGERSHTTRYMRLITGIAAAVRTETPNVRIGAFAYEDYIDPPPSMPTLPANVDVDVIQYGIYNLPLSSASNRWMRSIMRDWSTRWEEPGHLGVYDWALLTHQARTMPVPLVRAAADRIKFWHRLGVRRIGTQADSTPEFWRANPWNFYAYSRLTWDVGSDTKTLLKDFFTAYYREAATPMLAYYTALENHLVDGDISLGNDLHYHPSDAAFPIALNRRLAAHLSDARGATRHWVTASRVRDASECFRNTLLRLDSPASRELATTIQLE